MSSEVAAWAAIVLVMMANLAVIAYGYGRLSQKVEHVRDLMHEHLQEHRETARS